MILIAELFTKKNSGEIARKRLKHLLTADRAGCSPELLDLIRADFLRSVSRYLEIDPGDVTLRILRTSSEQPAEVFPAARNSRQPRPAALPAAVFRHLISIRR